MKLKIDEIKVDMKYLPRKRLDVEAIERYKEAYELGEDLPPLIVQKEKKILIDGFHRFQAQWQLERAEVEVELLDIPEDQIYIEAVRRTVGHPLPPTKEDLDEQIFNLKVIHNLTFKRIGELVKRHETTVSARLKKNPDFKNLGTQDIKKLDGRTKDYDPKEIVERLDKGEKPADIASDLNISQPTISLVKKKEKEKQELLEKGPIVVCTNGFDLRDMFQYTTLRGKLDVEVNFQEDAVYITGFTENKKLGVFGRFSRHYFDSYSVKDPLTWFVNGEAMMKMVLYKSILNAGFIQLTLKDNRMTLKFEGLTEGTYSHGDFKMRERPINSAFEKMKEENVMDQRACKVRVKHEEFRGMPESDKVTATFKDGKLMLSGVSRGWKFEKDIIPIEFEGENVQVEVDNTMLGRVISQQKGVVNMFLVDEEKKYLMVNLNGMEHGEYFIVNYVVV